MDLGQLKIVLDARLEWTRVSPDGLKKTIEEKNFKNKIL